MRKLLAVTFCMLALVHPLHADSTPHWTEVRSPHFVVLTDTSEKQGRKVAGQFERMRALFRAVLPNAAGDAGLPITVLALKDSKGFKALEPAAYLAKGQLQLAGLFLQTGDRNYILLRLDAEGEHPFAVVYHEYTHFILRKADFLPLWLNEGLAEFYQNTDIEDKDVKLGQPSSDDILYLRQNNLLPLPTLFAVNHNSPYYHDEQKGSVFYSESWALTHFIEITDSLKKTNHLGDYVRLVSKHTDPVVAAQQAFGDLGQLQKALDSYVSQSNYQLFKMNTSFTADESSFQARPISLTDVNATRADVLAHNDRQPEARALLDAVLHDDPKNALAHETLGKLAYQAHDMPAAKKWYGEAVALDSQSYIAQYNYGVLSMMDNDTGKDDSIEASLRACIKLEPGFAPAYDALAHFYAARHTRLDEATKLDLEAIKLEPEQLSFRLNTAQILAEEKNFDPAIKLLEQTAATTAKSPSEVAEVQMHLAQIKQYQTQLEQNKNQLAQYQAANQGSVPSGEVTTTERTVLLTRNKPPEEERTYPAPSPSAPHHTVRGVVRNVKCTYPTVLTLSVDQAGKSVTLFSPNYFKVSYTTTFKPTGDMDPCKVMDGMKARIEYADVSDKDLAGQVVSIELSR